MKLIIYTDGASRGNPGPASYGFTISEGKGKLVYEKGEYIGITTNNVAEYTAVLGVVAFAVATYCRDCTAMACVINGTKSRIFS